ncbi:MAG: hypothetical protein A3F78_04380 [Burkholderiales bacterium RIFCSPLOWO2_12_FULL_61_40]|nr:MAG: hypothetical protein A3F78_04380 [Burkholderiales bacterium RIFCSPLOWO2_12_FULL_61_40]
MAQAVVWGGVATASAWAQTPAAAESRIDQVTLYPGSATVERVAKVQADAKKLVFACLPVGLDVQSLAVAADPAVRVGELSVQTEERGASALCAGMASEGRIRELEDKKAALAAENDALDMVTAYLKGLASPDAAQGAAKSAPDPKNLAAMADALRRTGQESLLRQHQIQRQQEDLDRLLKPLLAENSRAQAGRARLVNVHVTLDTTRDAEVRLSYQINGPGWSPSYRALLDTSTQALHLERQAQVAQATGEDWNGVQMRLSTGRPSRGTTGPQPRPWRISIAQLQMGTTMAMGGYAMSAPMAPIAAPAPAAMGARSRLAVQAPEGTDLQPESFDAGVFNHTFATEFLVPQRITVPSSGQRVTLALGRHDAKAELLVRTVPQMDASAWLVAEMPQPEGVWPAGPLQLYRDGAYVGTDTLRTGGAYALSLWFGRDEQVQVQVEPQKDMKGSTGFVGARAERTVARGYTVENRHRTAIALQLIEAAPVSTDELVKIEAKFSPQPETLEWQAQPGSTLWRTRLEAGAKARFSAAYAISYPKEARLLESR